MVDPTRIGGLAACLGVAFAYSIQLSVIDSFGNTSIIEVGYLTLNALLPMVLVYWLARLQINQSTKVDSRVFLRYKPAGLSVGPKMRLNPIFLRSVFAGGFAVPVLLGLIYLSAILFLQKDFEDVRPGPSGDVILLVLMGTILRALTEELLFRGVLMEYLGRRSLFAVVVSSMVFGAAHATVEPVAVLLAGGLGLLYGAMRMAGVSLLALTLLHVFGNALSGGELLYLGDDRFAQLPTIIMTLGSHIAFALVIVAWVNRADRQPV